MLELNYDKITEMESQLTYFRGWLPFRLWKFVNIRKRNSYLQTLGLFEEVQEANALYKALLIRADNYEELEDKLLREFVEDNPRFSEILI